jgi:ketosteroid isomerase-like protein
MAEEDVAALERMLEAFNGADIARVIELADPDFEGTVAAELSAEPDTYRGHGGLRRYFESFHEAMEEIHFELLHVRDAGTSVVAEVRLTARGRRTAIDVEQRIAQVWAFRDGRALRVLTYASLAQALSAAGIEQ